MAYVMTFEAFLEEWRSDSDVIAAHTSGSTGVPKTIELKKEFVRESAGRTNSFFSLNSGSRLHSCVAADFIGGKMMAVRSELAGCLLTWETPSNTPLSNVGKDEEIDLLAVVPSQMLHIVSHIEDMPHMRAIIVGGSAIHPDLRKKIIGSGLNVYETYGMTETASHIALRRVADGVEWFSPLEGVTVRLDGRGCLCIDFATGESMVTNDMARLNGKGGFRIVGRYDNMIVTGGKKVNPEDLERRLSTAVSCEFIISSRPDEKWGQVLVMRMERDAFRSLCGGAEEGEVNLNEEWQRLRDRLRTVVEPYEVPKELELVERLERTSNGKLKRGS